MSKGTKVLSGGGPGGSERAHCLKRTTGRTPTASDYACQWPHCTVPAPLLRQYQALNQHRWLELQAQRRRQEQEWVDFQAQKAAAGFALSAGFAPYQPALPSIIFPRQLRRLGLPIHSLFVSGLGSLGGKYLP